MPASTNATAQDQFTHGRIIGEKYRVDGVLGSGGMGVVLSATHLELDSPVAIKVLRAELATHSELASQLLFEARAVARLRSAHVVRIIDVARLPNGVPYIVMEQLRGTDLASLLAERGAMSIPDAVDYLRQACEGLREAHQLGIVHRDLKPENLFLARTPEGLVLKILDFGISKYVGGVGGALRRAPRSTLTKTGNAVGSPFYMAPEQMRAAPDLDARADIWSLGAILYELLTARCPFEAESTAALCAKVMTDDAPSLRAFSESIPEQLDEILRRCLEKQPSARYQSVDELAEALDEFAAAEAARSSRHASGVDLRVDPPKEGRGTVIALGGVCALLLAAGVAFWHLQFGSAAHPPLSASALASDALASEKMSSRPMPPLPRAEPDPTTEPVRAREQVASKPLAAAAAVWPVPTPPAPQGAPEPAPVVAPEVVPEAPRANDVVLESQPALEPPPIPAPPSPRVQSPRAISDPALRYGL